MQGDPKVDELMRPVNAAIDRHVKDRDAKVDIYNRAYEAVQNGMDYLANGTYCAYCGAEFPFDDHTATLVGEHIRTCEKHPMRAVEVRAKKAEGEVKSITERCKELESRLDLYHGNMMDVLQDALHKASEKITALESSLSALREQTRWIPVEEELPEKERPVLIVRIDCGGVESVAVKQLVGDDDWADENLDYWIDASSVTHWMPLPKRPIDLPDADKESE